jgi:hypothetical protein
VDHLFDERGDSLVALVVETGGKPTGGEMSHECYTDSSKETEMNKKQRKKREKERELGGNGYKWYTERSEETETTKQKREKQREKGETAKEGREVLCW